MTMKVFPSLHAARIGHLQDELDNIARVGADAVHIDAMDGNVVPNIAFGPTMVAELRTLTSLPFDLHLMVTRSEYFVDKYREAGVDAITVHIETTPHPIRLLKHIVSLGCKAGIALNPATPVSGIVHVLDYVQQVTVMSVDPGYSHQTFLPLALGKVRALRELAGSELEIAVDGGVRSGQISRQLATAGASILIAGGGLFEDETIDDAMREMRHADLPLRTKLR